MTYVLDDCQACELLGAELCPACADAVYVAFERAATGTAPGSYCLARCYCGGCPQYAQQTAAVALLREQEIAARVRRDSERAERRRRAGTRRSTPIDDPTLARQ